MLPLLYSDVLQVLVLQAAGVKDNVVVPPSNLRRHGEWLVTSRHFACLPVPASLVAAVSAQNLLGWSVRAEIVSWQIRASFEEQAGVNDKNVPRNPCSDSQVSRCWAAISRLLQLVFCLEFGASSTDGAHPSNSLCDQLTGCICLCPKDLHKNIPPLFHTEMEMPIRIHEDAPPYTPEEWYVSERQATPHTDVLWLVPADKICTSCIPRQGLLGWLLMVDLPRNVDAFIAIGYSLFNAIVKSRKKQVAIVMALGKGAARVPLTGGLPII